MSEKYDEFLDEIQHDMRQEKWIKLWEQYQKHILAAVSFVMVSMVLYTTWDYYAIKKQKEISLLFSTAWQLEQTGKPDKAQSLLETVSQTNHKIYRTLSLFYKAAIMQNTPQKLREALKVYDALQVDSRVPDEFKDLAFVLKSLKSIDRINALSPSETQETLKRIEALIAQSSPWMLLAMEVKGMILIHQKQWKEAKNIFVAIAQNSNTPKHMSMRARAVAQFVEIQEGLPASLS